jgi:hypothetical protein
MQPLLQHPARIDERCAVSNRAEQRLDELRLCGPPERPSSTPPRRVNLKLVSADLSAMDDLDDDALSTAEYEARLEELGAEIPAFECELGRIEDTQRRFALPWP